jgi:hypothetical protein
VSQDTHSQDGSDCEYEDEDDWHLEIVPTVPVAAPRKLPPGLALPVSAKSAPSPRLHSPRTAALAAVRGPPLLALPLSQVKKFDGENDYYTDSPRLSVITNTSHLTMRSLGSKISFTWPDDAHSHPDTDTSQTLLALTAINVLSQKSL